MLWKKLHQTISLNDKHAALGFSFHALWQGLLVNSDTKGRYPADLRIVRSQVLPLYEDVTDDMIETAINRLAEVGLLHRYEVGGKRFVVLHDHEESNPTGNLRYQRPRWPAPPGNLCECVQQDATPAPAPAPAAPAPPSASVEDRLCALAEQQRIIGSKEQIRNHVRGWVATHGEAKVEGILRAAVVVGQDVFDIHKKVFARKGPEAELVKCEKCGAANAREIKGRNPTVLGKCRNCGEAKAG